MTDTRRLSADQRAVEAVVNTAVNVIGGTVLAVAVTAGWLYDNSPDPRVLWVLRRTRLRRTR